MDYGCHCSSTGPLQILESTDVTDVWCYMAFYLHDFLEINAWSDVIRFVLVRHGLACW